MSPNSAPGKNFRWLSAFRVGHIALSLLVYGLFVPPLSAQEAHSDPMKGHSAETTGHPHDFHLSLFAGFTEEAAHDDAKTFGLELERRLGSGERRIFGFGALVERVEGEGDPAIVAAPALYLHPSRYVKILVAAGAEIKDDEENFLVRLGLGVDIPAGRYSFGPSYSVDFVDGEEFAVYGFSFGIGF